MSMRDDVVGDDTVCTIGICIPVVALVLARVLAGRDNHQSEVEAKHGMSGAVPTTLSGKGYSNI